MLSSGDSVIGGMGALLPDVVPEEIGPCNASCFGEGGASGSDSAGEVGAGRAAGCGSAAAEFVTPTRELVSLDGTLVGTGSAGTLGEAPAAALTSFAITGATT